LFLRQWDCAGLGSALLHRRMGGCEISLTDPSVAPLAPNIPFVVPGGEAGSHSGGAGFDHLEAQVAAR